jgi:quinol-cytochrome oxidoreductase complex cytochrome b subunit
MSVPPKVEAEWTANPSARREMKFLPNFLLRELMAWYVAIGVLAALAAIFPWGLGVKADPFVSAPAGIKPEWYFLFMFQTLKDLPTYLPSEKLPWVEGDLFGILFFGFLGLMVALVPLLDRGAAAGRPRRVLNFFAFLTVVFAIFMTVRSLAVKPPQNPLAKTPPAAAAGPEGTPVEATP